MSFPEFDIDAYVAAAAAAAGLTIDAACHDEVARQLTLVARAAALVAGADAGARGEEPAPIFTPGLPEC